MNFVVSRAAIEIDRTTSTPVLVRCYWKLHRHRIINEYRSIANDIYPNQEVQIYTWPDASLREIRELLKDAIPYVRETSSVMEFSLVYIDRTGDWALRQIGRITAGKPGLDDKKTLSQINFSPGDMLDIAITPAPRTNDN